MTPTVTQNFSEAAFEAFLEARREPEWLVEFRRTAWSRFQSLGYPTRKEEEWMRTDIRLFKLENYALPIEAAAGSEALPPALLKAGVEVGGNSAAFGSRNVGESLDAKWANKGVIFGSLDRLIVERGDKLKPYFLSGLVDSGLDKFAALQAACWSGGHVLYVPRNVAVDQPLHAFSAMGNKGVDLGRTLVVLEEGAEATLLCETASVSATDDGLHCGATEVILQPGARLRLVTLQNWGHKVWHFAHQKAQVDRDGGIQWTLGALGSRLAKVNQHVELVGPGAETQVNGVMFTEGKQHLSYHTLQHHRARDCRSDFLYKSALQDASRTVWRGMIKVDPGAVKTDGYQRNDNLLLSHEARADSIPGLEIEADDVRCTHGSTSGRVDEELIFYAMARGYTRREAIRMIVTGFFQQVFDRISVESVREALALAINRKVREYE